MMYCYFPPYVSYVEGCIEWSRCKLYRRNSSGKLLTEKNRQIYIQTLHEMDKPERTEIAIDGGSIVY